MSQHTPGGWTADLEGREPGDDVPVCAPDLSGVYIATVAACWPCAEDEEGEQEAEGLANARLIAAAPALYDACECVRAAASRHRSGPVVLSLGELNRVHLALALVEGESPNKEV